MTQCLLSQKHQTKSKQLPQLLIFTQLCPVFLILILAKYLVSVASKPCLSFFDQVQLDFSITPRKLISSGSATPCCQIQTASLIFSYLTSQWTHWTLLSHSLLHFGLWLTFLLHPVSRCRWAHRFRPQPTSSCFVYCFFR